MVLAVIGVPIALALAVGGDVQPLSVQRAAAPPSSSQHRAACSWWQPMRRSSLPVAR